MPELPEVETYVRELEPLLSGCRILAAEVRWPRTIAIRSLIFPTSAFIRSSLHAAPESPTTNNYFESGKQAYCTTSASGRFAPIFCRSPDR